MSLHPVILFQNLIQHSLSTLTTARILNLTNLTSTTTTIKKFSDHNLEAYLLEDKSRALFWDKSESVRSRFSKLIVSSGLPSLKYQLGYDWTSSIFIVLGLPDFEIDTLSELENSDVYDPSIEFALTQFISIVSVIGIACLIIDDESSQYSLVAPIVPYRSVYLLRSKVIEVKDSDHPNGLYPLRVYRRECGSEIGISKILANACVPETRFLDFKSMALASLVGVITMEIRYNGDGFVRQRTSASNMAAISNNTLRKILDIFGIENIPIQDRLTNMNLNFEKTTPVTWTLEYRRARELDPLVAKTNLEFASTDLKIVRERANSVVPRHVKKKVGAKKGFKFTGGHSVMNFERNYAKKMGIINHVFIPVSLVLPIQRGTLYIGFISTFSNDVSVVKYFMVGAKHVITHMIVVLVENCSAQPITRPTAIYDIKSDNWTATVRCAEYFSRLEQEMSNRIEADSDSEDTYSFFDVHLFPSKPEILQLSNYFRMGLDECDDFSKAEFRVQTFSFPAPTRLYHDLSTWYNVWPSMTNESYHSGKVDIKKDLAGSFSTACRADDNIIGFNGVTPGLIMPCGIEVPPGSHSAMTHQCAFQMLGYYPNDNELKLLAAYREKRSNYIPMFARMMPCGICRRVYPNKVLAWLCNSFGCPGGNVPSSAGYYNLSFTHSAKENVNSTTNPLKSEGEIHTYSTNWASASEEYVVNEDVEIPADPTDALD